MKTRLLSLLLSFSVLLLLCSGCQKQPTEPEPEPTSESTLQPSGPTDAETTDIQPWNEERTIDLLDANGKLMRVSVNASYSFDHDANRKAVGGALTVFDGLEAVEEPYAGTEMRWVKCSAVLTPASDPYAFVNDLFLFASFLSPDGGMSSMFSVFGGESGGLYQRDPDDDGIPCAIYMSVKDHSDLTNPRITVTTYAYLPVGQESQFTFSVAKVAKGSHETFQMPDLPDSSVLCWKLPTADGE